MYLQKRNDSLNERKLKVNFRYLTALVVYPRIFEMGSVCKVTRQTTVLTNIILF